MTLISQIPFKINKKKVIRTPLNADFNDVSIVIPVKDNQDGVNTYLKSFFSTHSSIQYPKEILIIDNNSLNPIFIPKEYADFDFIKLHQCEKIGPASARNMGAKLAKGNWILFNDSDCLPSKSLMSGYLDNLNGAVAYVGNVRSLGSDLLSKYYETQEILLPLKIIDKDGNHVPQYLITANSLVWKDALTEVNGFNENIKIASGEDVDLGLRLSEIGNLSFAFDALVFHDFNDGIKGFWKRFVRYGKGNKTIGFLYNVNMIPLPFKPNAPSFYNYLFAFFQYLGLLYGYYFEK